MRLSLSLAALAAFTLAPATAQATCMEDCSVATTDAACSPSEQVTFTTEDFIYVHGACSVSCCAPYWDTGVQCFTESAQLQPGLLGIRKDGGSQPLLGAFVDTGTHCGTDALLMFDRPLEAGSYWVDHRVGVGHMVAPFDVEQVTGGCSTRTGEPDATGAAMLLAIAIVTASRRRG